MPSRTWRWLTIAAVAAFAAFRLPELTRYALWYDELFSLTLAQMDWGDLFAAAVRDRTNPPLFYALLKLWIGIGGTSVAWMRLLPCLFGILVAVPLVGLARRYLTSGADGRASLAASVATVAAGAASPLLVFLSNELRAYSLLTFLSMLSLYLAGRLTDTLGWEATIEAEGDSPNGLGDVAPERRRRLVLLALVNIALVYAHYFGWLLVVSELAVIAIWRRGALRWHAMANVVAAAAFVPWVAAVVVSSRGVAAPLTNVAWISRPTLLDVPLFYDALVARVLTLDTAWVGAAILTAAGLGLIAALRRRTGFPGGVQVGELAVLALLPVALAFGASVMSARPVFVPRYLVVAAPAWLLLIGAAVSALGSLGPAKHPEDVAFRRRAAALTFAAFTLLAGVLRERRGGEKIAWDRLVGAIAADAGPAGGTIYSLEGFTALPAAFYAAQAPPGLTVRPVGSLAGIRPPAWLLVRSGPDSAAPSLGDGLAPAGVSLRPLLTERIPSQTITVYRVAPR